MKISLSKKDIDEFQKILEIKDLNIMVSDIILDTFMYTDFLNKTDFEHKVKVTGSLEKALTETIIKNYNIDDEKIKHAIIERIKVQKCNESEYKNEYVQLIKDRKIKFKNYKTVNISYEPYQLFAVNEINIDQEYKEILNIGYFENKFSYTALFENKDLWMSVNPNEIETMKDPIHKAHGDVLVLGLGMGYIAYMMSIKNDVKSVTVIEKSIDNIDAIKSYIGNELLGSNKVKIINADAVDYLQSNHNFDYVYADLWFNPEDGLLPYMSIKKIADKYNLDIDYWLEESLKQMKRRYLIELINEHLNGSDESNYKSEESTADLIFKILYNETKDVSIKNINDIKELLK